jgi:transposase InsO family protein
MFGFILFLLKILFLPLSETKREIILQFLTIMKENAILLRKHKASGKKIKFRKSDKLFFALLSALSGKFKSHISIVKPETVLKWFKGFIKNKWTFPSKKKTGRPETPAEIRNLILQLKNENVFWGNRKIQGELLKLGIRLDKNTIAKIIRNFRKQGKIRKGLTWKKFIESHINSLFAMDFFTLDSLFGNRFYIFFIICLHTKEIVKYRVIESPAKFFVQQQLMDWRWDKEEEKVYLIHDHDPMFMNVDYRSFGIRDVPTCPYAPNMNAIAERFVRSVRNEALDWFVIINQEQVERILENYIPYYNKFRPHQGLGQQTPVGYEPRKEGEIIAFPVLSGLHYYYMRKAA